MQAIRSGDPLQPRTRQAGALADFGFISTDRDPEAPVIITGYKTTRTRETTPLRVTPTRPCRPPAPLDRGPGAV